LSHGRLVERLRFDVRTMDHSPLEERDCHRAIHPGTDGEHVARKKVKYARAGVIKRCEMTELAVEPHEGPIDATAQADRTLGNRIERRLHVCRRARDDLEDLTSRRQVAIAGLQLLEQPHVLDGDDRLIRERLEELDLLVRERVYLGTP